MNKMLNQINNLDDFNEIKKIVIDYYKEFYFDKVIKVFIDNQEFIFTYLYYNYDLINKHFILRSNLISNIDKFTIFLSNTKHVKIEIDDRIIEGNIDNVKINQFNGGQQNTTEYEVDIIFEKVKDVHSIVNSNTESNE